MEKRSNMETTDSFSEKIIFRVLEMLRKEQLITLNEYARTVQQIQKECL